MECELCGKTTNGQRGISSHLRQTHEITTLEKFKEYYDKYLLHEDTTCPICKMHQRKFISFEHGYSSTCIGQKDENGKNLTCRFIWNNKDKEKASRIQIETIKKLKETQSEIDSTKTKYQIQKENWYSSMTEKDETGKDKFDKIGEKVSIFLNCVNVKSGKTNAKLIGEKSKDTRLNTPTKGGITIAQHHTLNAAITVDTTIMPDGRTQKEHMTEKAMDTRKNTILPNGLSILQNTAMKAYQTKIENGTLPKYHGYSKISKQTFESIIDKLNLDQSKCYYADHEFQLIDDINNTFYRLDFCYTDSDNQPILIIEFNGNSYHLRESELISRADDISPHGDLIILSYPRDQQKKFFIKTNYPKCEFYEIWEDTIESDIQLIKFGCVSVI